MKKFFAPFVDMFMRGTPHRSSARSARRPLAKFEEQTADSLTWADEHRVGVAAGVDPEIVEGLRMNFTGECSEVGMYLAMARQAHREGYPEIGLYYEKAAYEEAEHAAKFAELLGEVVFADTKKNLELRVAAENGACRRQEEARHAAPRNSVSTRSTTPSTRCARTRRATAAASRACSNRYFK